MQGKREEREREEGNEKRSKDHFTAVLSKKKTNNFKITYISFRNFLH